MKNHEYDLIGSYINTIDSKGNIITEKIGADVNSAIIAEILRFRDCIPHPSWFCKRFVYEKLIGYRNIPCNEDYDFLLRMLDYDMKIGLVPEVLLLYRINPNGITIGKSFLTFITFYYLQINRKRITTVSLDEIKKYINKNNTSVNAERYNNAQNIFIASKGKKIIKRIIMIAQSMMISKYFRAKIKNRLCENALHIKYGDK